jgi:hypothetical protein
MIAEQLSADTKKAVPKDDGGYSQMVKETQIRK